MPTVIIPPPVIIYNNKQCIVSEWKKYCEEEDISEKELWFLFFLLAFICIYTVALFKVADWNWYVAFWWMIILPLIALWSLAFI
jgi:hypothetical protein